MNFSYLIMLVAALGIALGLYMKFNAKDQPDKAYINYKTSFLMVVGAGIIIIQGISIMRPSLSSKLDMIMSGFLIVAILVDAVVKRSMRKK
ncbi:MAG: hypothetical protein ACM3X7_03650 [Solirubrobacterales bacterium]